MRKICVQRHFLNICQHLSHKEKPKKRNEKWEFFESKAEPNSKSNLTTINLPLNETHINVSLAHFLTTSSDSLLEKIAASGRASYFSEITMYCTSYLLCL